MSKLKKPRKVFHVFHPSIASQSWEWRRLHMLNWIFYKFQEMIKDGFFEKYFYWNRFLPPPEIEPGSLGAISRWLTHYATAPHNLSLSLTRSFIYLSHIKSLSLSLSLLLPLSLSFISFTLFLFSSHNLKN